MGGVDEEGVDEEAASPEARLCQRVAGPKRPSVAARPRSDSTRPRTCPITLALGLHPWARGEQAAP